MSHNDPSLKPADRIRLGHPSRLHPETQELTFLVIGLFAVFAVMMAHDEIVQNLVATGWIVAAQAEKYELVVGAVLLVVWSAIIVRLVGIVRRARSPDRHGW